MEKTNWLPFVADRPTAERKYEELRDTARSEAEAFWRGQGFDVRFKRFDTDAFAQVAGRWTALGRKVAWDWPDQFVYRRRKRPTRWDLALWTEGYLLAMALGYSSRWGKTILYLEGVERLPGDHPYAPLVIPMVLDATERYARLLRSRQIVLIEPYPKLMRKYEAAGYTRQYVAAIKEYAAVKAVEAV